MSRTYLMKKSLSLKPMYQHPTKSKADTDKIDEVKKRYEEDMLSHKHFSDELGSEYKSRELGKLRWFNQSRHWESW